MTSAIKGQYDVDVDDVEYLRHDDTPLLARLYKPRGTGPFPAIVDIHGGCWCIGDRLMDAAISTRLAHNGIFVASLDFRMPPDAPYPGSLVDINYGIRWLKAESDNLHINPERVGILGNSSGGHLAILTAMRPKDQRYSTLPSPSPKDIDASLRCAILCWPVIDPLARYQYAKELRSAENHPDFADVVVSLQDQFWQTEAAMAEGNPLMALERGESLTLPPVLYIQGTKDQMHPRASVDRFVTNYRAVGGEIDLRLFEGQAEGFINRDPSAAPAEEALRAIVDCARRRLGE